MHRQAVIFIFITVLVDSIGFGIVIPVMPALLMQVAGADISHAAYWGGALWFAYALTQFFGAPLAGNLSDRFGRRPILLCALAALGIDYLIMGIAPTVSVLIVGRLIAGAAGSTYSTANAYVADISNDDNRTQNFGLIGAAFGGGFILGPAIGGFLGEFGPRVPFFAAAVLSLLNVLYGIFVLRESLALKDRRPFDWRRANPLGALVHLRSNPAVFGLAVALFLYMLGHYSLPATWSFYVIEKFNWSEADVGLSLSYVGVLMVAVQAGLIRVLIPKLGPSKAGILGMVLMAVSFLGYALSAYGWQMYLWMTVASLAGLVMPSYQSAMTSQVEANSQGELQGAIAILTSITTIIGPVLMTQLFGYFTSPSVPLYLPGAPFLMASLLTVCALGLFILVIGKAPQPVQAKP